MAAFAEPDRLRPHPPGRPQDRAAGGARPPRPAASTYVAARVGGARPRARASPRAALIDGEPRRASGAAARRRAPSRRRHARRSAGSAPTPSRPAAPPPPETARRPAGAPLSAAIGRLCGSRVPEDDQAARLQVVRRPGRGAPRAGGRGRRRAERVGEVEHLRRDPLGDRLAEPAASCAPRSPTTSSSPAPPARAAADFCEVELVFDNESGAWPEPSLRRGLALPPAPSRRRGPVPDQPRAPVRRLDLVELLSDVGLGGGLRSVDLAGERRVGARRQARRAARTRRGGGGARTLQAAAATAPSSSWRASPRQVERAADLEAEVRKRLRPLALQATAAERAAKLAARARAHRRRRSRRSSSPSSSERRRRRRASAERRRRSAARLDERARRRSSAERVEAEEELDRRGRDARGGTAALYRLRAGAERLELRREAAEALASACAASSRQPRWRRPPTAERASPAALARERRRGGPARRRPGRRARLARERLAALDQSLAQREGLPPAARSARRTRASGWRSPARGRAGTRARRRGGARPPRLGAPRWRRRARRSRWSSAPARRASAPRRPRRPATRASSSPSSTSSRSTSCCDSPSRGDRGGDRLEP